MADARLDYRQPLRTPGSPVDGRRTTRHYALVTSGPEVARGGAALLVFSLVGLLYVHFLLPWINGAIGFPAWHEAKWAKRWNYGILLALCAIGGAVTIVGLAAWAARRTFG
jgi:hypothetical protein